MAYELPQSNSNSHDESAEIMVDLTIIDNRNRKKFSYDNEILNNACESFETKWFTLTQVYVLAHVFKIGPRPSQ